MALIDRQYTDRPFYGSRRMVAWLNLDMGEQVNRKRVQRLMRVMGLEAIHPKPRLSASDRNHKVYPYLLRDASIERIDRVWSTEIVYSQMTKPAGLAGRSDREHITDLDGVPGHHNPIDE